MSWIRVKWALIKMLVASLFWRHKRQIRTGMTYGQLLDAIGKLANSKGQSYYSVGVSTVVSTAGVSSDWRCYINRYGSTASNSKGAGQRTPEEALSVMVERVENNEVENPLQMSLDQVAAATGDA